MNTVKHLQAAANAICAVVPTLKINLYYRADIDYGLCEIFNKGQRTHADHPLKTVGFNLAADIQLWYPNIDKGLLENLRNAPIEE